MAHSTGVPPLPAAVPIFPLPGVVLFPGAVLPLHIFEERYKQMTADVLRAGHRQIAMALLRPGWERDYYTRPAVEPVVCIGTILTHERLADGRYNFLLQGHTRAQVVEELASDEPYRLMRLEPLVETETDEDPLREARTRLAELFERGSYASLPGGMQMRQLLATEVPTAVVADLLAYNLLSEGQTPLKQTLLAETNVRLRVWKVVEAVAALRPAWQNLPQQVGLN
jgi:Lon protease-like protein